MTPVTSQSPLRLHIVGASGAGTTTLGQALAAPLSLTHLDTDHYYWVPTQPPFVQKREVAVRHDMLFADLQTHPRLVLSGSVVGWGSDIEDAFDLIVFLTLDGSIRMERLRARELARYGRVDEEFVQWAGLYDDGPPEGRSLAKHEAWLAARTCPLLRLAGDLSVDARVQRVIERVRALEQETASQVKY